MMLHKWKFEVYESLRYFFRPFYISCGMKKVIPNNLKGKSKSSEEWLYRHLNDAYVKQARYDRYRCRSAYKLLEIDNKFNILKPHFAVVDCGAAPGSWTQVVVKKLKLDTTVHSNGNTNRNGLVVAVDLQHIDPIKGAIIFKECNFLDPTVQDHICSILPDGKADVILSDMAPNATGTADLDSAAIMNLVYNALKFSIRTLKENGTFLCKVWDGSDVNKVVNALNNLFSSVKRVKPKASRMDSSEIFLLAMGFKQNYKVSA